ncbi:diaminopimelate epimerase [Candidatus Omnitrophota bacterium]
MRKLNFTKMVASGNDFVVAGISGPQAKLKRLARGICDRKYGIGADGLLAISDSRRADIRMRVFNADGSEAQMCGNGARCVAVFYGKGRSRIETKAGIINAEVAGDLARVRLTDPKGLRFDLPVRLARSIRVNFLNTGVPHAVVFAGMLDKIDVVPIGRQIRNHKKFAPEGTNADFVEIVNNNLIKIRTYERGVEDETLACGTGAVAAAVISCLKHGIPKSKGSCRVSVATKSGERLKVYFNRSGMRITDVWLEGRVRIISKGVYYV